MDTNQHLHLSTFNVDFRANAAKAIRLAYSAGVVTRPDALLVYDAKVNGMGQQKLMSAHKIDNRRMMVVRRENAWRRIKEHTLNQPI